MTTAPKGVPPVRILVVNPNTTRAMTDSIAMTARRYASAGTEILPLTARYGADGIDTAFEGLLSAVAVMDRVTTYEGEYDAVVMAGFGEPGRDGLAELISAPVLDIAECSAMAAMLVGRSYSVVTTLDRSVPAIEDRLLLAGLSRRCASVRATGMSTMATERDPQRAVAAVVEQARLAVQQDKAEVICLGCGGMAGLEEAVAAAVGVPVVDGVGAAVRFAESLVALGLRTSKVRTFAHPEAKPLVGWPLSNHMDQGRRM
jgi:allantoin racemase